MAKIYGNSKGEIIRIIAESMHEKIYPDDPEGTVSTLEFDQYENIALIKDMAYDITPYTLVSGELLKDGQPVAIAADGTKFQEEQDLNIIKASLLAGNALTQQDLTTLVKYVFTKLGI